MVTLLVAVAAVVAMVLQPSVAFLPTSLNFSDPAVEPFFCPSQMSGNTWDHKAITREALRREVRRFLLESVSGTNVTLTIPEDASLTQIFRAYYGPNASPTRFIKSHMIELMELDWREYKRHQEKSENYY